jgi:hypothetical protein
MYLAKFLVVTYVYLIGATDDPAEPKMKPGDLQ